MITNKLELIKDQVSFHDYVSNKPLAPEKQKKQRFLRSRFQELYDDLNTLSHIADDIGVSTFQEFSEKIRVLIKKENNNTNEELTISADITPEDIANLTEEELEQLGLSDSAKQEFQILEFISKNGGVASVRKVMIGIKAMTGKMPEKQTLNNKLYRMTQKKDSPVLFSATEYGQGFYTTISPKNENEPNEIINKGGDMSKEPFSLNLKQ